MSPGGSIVGRATADGLLAAIVECTADAVFAVDAGGSVLSWNPAAEALYGYSAEEVVGSPVSVLLPADEPWEAWSGPGFRGERVAHRGAVRIRKDGSEAAVGETLSPVLGTDGKIVALASIAHDIRTQVEAEEALAAARQELEVKNRHLQRSNEELEQFAYVASHDLSEPLRAVAGMVGLLSRRYRGRFDDDADEFIDFAIEGCERLRAMIEDLLAFSRAGRGDPERSTVDTGDLVARVVSALSAQIERSGAVIRAEGLPVVAADASQLHQVLQNLISNGIKFAKPGRPATVEISARRDGGAWRFEVADDGIGVEPQYRERIFRMFQRLHVRDKYAGNGIGLAIAERIVLSHGGAIGVDGNDQGGSTFWFTIPDHPQEEQ